MVISDVSDAPTSVLIGQVVVKHMSQQQTLTAAVHTPADDIMASDSKGFFYLRNTDYRPKIEQTSYSFVFTDHPTMLAQWQDSKLYIIRLLYGHLTYIVGCPNELLSNYPTLHGQ